MAALLMAAWPMVASAQSTQTSTTDTTTTTQTTQTTTPDPDDDTFFGTDSHWIGSAFVGGNFGQDSDESSVNFGGSVGYLWRGIAGGEFMADFAPDFRLEPGRSALLNDSEPWINSYMANAIVAVPLGEERSWQPYVSGGLGVLSLRSDSIDSDDNTLTPDSMRPAGNLGFGVLGFLGGVGLRGDVRWFRGFERSGDVDSGDSAGDIIGSTVLSQLQFWRANVGVAFRW
jgi:hypothetical protein